jgi:hypothetical protein
MNEYSNKIALVRNRRGVYCIDTIMGCPSGMANTEGGCYGDCYAARSAKRYGRDFSTAVLRRFESEGHKKTIQGQIARLNMPFVRIGCSGDPSEDWGHTIGILKEISGHSTELVIITRHWNALTDSQLEALSGMNMCINTSVSALDTVQEMNRAVAQFERVKPFCKSVLRVVTCEFNLDDETGLLLSEVQDELLRLHPVIDTVFRPSKGNEWVKSGIVNAKNHFFNGRKQLASKHNPRAYMGKCETCVEMCGVNLETEYKFQNRPGVIRQMKLEV